MGFEASKTHLSANGWSFFNWMLHRCYWWKDLCQLRLLSWQGYTTQSACPLLPKGNSSGPAETGMKQQPLNQ